MREAWVLQKCRTSFDVCILLYIKRSLHESNLIDEHLVPARLSLHVISRDPAIMNAVS
jgi:hypothetical protein